MHGQNHIIFAHYTSISVTRN